MKQADFWDSLAKNKGDYTKYLMRLTELSLSTFEWKNLPDTIDVRYLELALFAEGKAVFFKDEVMGYLALKCAVSGNLNVYGIPQKYRAYSSYNGYNKELNLSDSVIIYNNMLRTNTLPDVMKYAMRIYELDQIIDINAKAQKTPILITCEENERLTMKNLYLKYDGNTPVIYGNKNLNVNGFKVLSTGAPYLCDKLYELKNQIWNEALTYLGISNLNIQKKERLITDEVQRNQGGTIASRYSRLEARKKACAEINKMFDLNIDVEFKDGNEFFNDEIYEEKESETE